MSASPALGEDKGSGKSINSVVKQLNDRLLATENQNKRLKDLLIYHLDLIQQQNELITEKDKLYQRLRQENDFMKTKLHQRHEFFLPPPSPPPLSVMLLPQKPPVAPTAVKIEPVQVKKETTFDSFDELLLPENNANSFLSDNEHNKSEEVDQNNFGILNTIIAADSDTKRYTAGDTDISTTDRSTSEAKSKYTNMQIENFKSVDNKRSLIKKEVIKSEPLYTVTSSGGKSAVQKNSKNKKKITVDTGNVDFISNNSQKLQVTSESSKALEEYDYFGINKKNEAMNTYVKTKNALATCTVTSATSTVTKLPMFGFLSDRFQLIDTTPTGQDPYQLGEADLVEQSPIPKLMLQKTNQGRIKIMDQTARRIYDPDLSDDKSLKTQSNHIPLNNSNADPKDEHKTISVQETCLDLNKKDKTDWRNNEPKDAISPDPCKSSAFPFLMGEVSFCDSLDNVASNVSLECNDVQDIFPSDSTLNVEELSGVAVFNTSHKSVDLPILSSPGIPNDSVQQKPQMPIFPKTSKRCKKKKHCTTTLRKGKVAKGAKAPAKRTQRRKVASNSKKISTPAMTTKKEYHTYVGDPDLTWYYGLDTDIKTDDLDHRTDQKSTTVEVPKWREKIFTGINTAEGTENLDDKTFEKRHQKYEAEERRQLRWHMRRIREQRRLEKLKQRQLDTWSTTVTVPPVYTVWPRPQKDIQFIEITDTLPVMAFGEPIPDIKEEEFSLPWVRTSDELKRSKRSRSKKASSSKYPQ